MLLHLMVRDHPRPGLVRGLSSSGPREPTFCEVDSSGIAKYPRKATAIPLLLSLPGATLSRRRHFGGGYVWPNPEMG